NERGTDSYEDQNARQANTGKRKYQIKSAPTRRIDENPRLKIRPDFDCVYRENNHGGHGDKSGRAMTFHFLIPVIPCPPWLLPYMQLQILLVDHFEVSVLTNSLAAALKTLPLR